MDRRIYPKYLYCHRFRKSKILPKRERVTCSCVVYYEQSPAFNHYIRNHWSIENNLHWQLDVTFREDLQRTRVGNAPENLAIVRKLALQLLNNLADKESIKSRRKLAGWNDQYLKQLLATI